LHFVGIAFWGADWLVTSIDRRLEDFKMEEMKNTVENDVVLKKRRGQQF